MSGPPRKIPGRGMGARKSSFARSFFNSAEGNGEEAELDESIPVPRSRPLGRMASRRNLSVARRPSMMSAPSQRGIEATRSGDSLSSAAASLASGSAGFTSAGSQRGSLGSPMAVAAAPPRNEQENWLRQSMLRQSGAAGMGGFDMNAIDAALKEDEALEAGFDDEEVLEQYRIMAQHEATLRVKANTGFDITEYEKRRKVAGNETKDKKELYGGGKKPKLGLPPPQVVSSSTTNNHHSHNYYDGGSNNVHGGYSAPPILGLSDRRSGNTTTSPNFVAFLEQQQQRAEALPELSQGENVRTTQTSEGEHVVRCWGCRTNLRVNYIATLVKCPECNTVSQARKRN